MHIYIKNLGKKNKKYMYTVKINVFKAIYHDIFLAIHTINPYGGRDNPINT